MIAAMRTAPTPIPAFAEVLRPLDGGALADLENGVLDSVLLGSDTPIR
jgi:hypothetical protein